MLNSTPSHSDVESAIQQEIVRVLQEKSTAEALPPITQDSRLGIDLGLSSLDLPQLVSLLEMSLQADPFLSLVPITSVRTVGDLYRAYQRFFSGEPVSTEDAELAASQRRAEARRAREGR